MPVFLLSDKVAFPPPHFAAREGLLAVGGDLSRERLLLAYRSGIFPWYVEGEPILWWSPDPRLVLYPSELHVSRTLARVLRRKLFTLTADRAFREVISACAKVRRDYGPGTWILDEIIEAFCDLHRAGYAHSMEAWRNGKLAGGLYGVCIGRSFFGESMFSLEDNASSTALVTLSRSLQALSFDLIDCQVATDHLKRFGAREVPRSLFLKQLRKSLTAPTLRGRWNLDDAGGIRLENECPAPPAP
jgi:leucyl/phenylalanyl-tRNA--protein transferase